MEKRSRNRLIVVTVIVLAVLAVFSYATIQGDKLAYYKTVTELKNDTALIGKSVSVGGEVVSGSIKKNGTHVTFTISDTKNTITVKFTGAVPSTFAAKVPVIATGKYVKADLVEADSLVTKCPSKYENKKIETK